MWRAARALSPARRRLSDEAIHPIGSGIVCVVLVTTAALGAYTYYSVETAIVPGQLERAEMRTQLLAKEIQAVVDAARADVTGFHSTAIDGIVRAALAGGVDPRDGTTLDQWRAQLASRLAAELAAKPIYRQFRVIGVADGGREIVRVDPPRAARRDPECARRRTATQSGSLLRQTGDQSAAGRWVYVSPIDLNRENGVIEVPHIPTLRIATPIRSEQRSSVRHSHHQSRPAAGVRSGPRRGERQPKHLCRQRRRRFPGRSRAQSRIRLRIRHAVPLAERVSGVPRRWDPRRGA